MPGEYGGYQDQAFVAELYDYLPGCLGRLDLGFYLNLARATEGSILELGCGTGRLLIPIAAAGYEIVGLDFSRYMLDRCREKLQGQPTEVQERARIVQGDMTQFDLSQTFGLITVPFRAFQHLLSIDEQLNCLRCVNRHLVKGHRLVLDLLQANPRWMHDPIFAHELQRGGEVALPAGRILRCTQRVTAFHRAEQYNEIEMIHYVTDPDGRTERLVQAFPFRYFSRYEVEHLLARCGFGVVDVFGNYDRSPLQDESPEMIFVAEKLEDEARCL